MFSLCSMTIDNVPRATPPDKTASSISKSNSLKSTDSATFYLDTAGYSGNSFFPPFSSPYLDGRMAVVSGSLVCLSVSALNRVIPKSLGTISFSFRPFYQKDRRKQPNLPRFLKIMFSRRIIIRGGLCFFFRPVRYEF